MIIVDYTYVLIRPLIYIHFIATNSCMNDKFPWQTCEIQIKGHLNIKQINYNENSMKNYNENELQFQEMAFYFLMKFATIKTKSIV